MADAKVTSLGEKLKITLEEKFAKTALLGPPFSELFHSCAKSWKVLLFLGGLVSPSSALASILTKGNPLAASKLACASFTFADFSTVCPEAAALGNVRNIVTRRPLSFYVRC